MPVFYNQIPEGLFTQEMVENFLEKYCTRDYLTGCLIWVEATPRKPYPRVRKVATINGQRIERSWALSRVIYAVHTGEDPGDGHVCHECDTPACCNFYHFYLGTPEQNALEAAEAGVLNRPEQQGMIVLGGRGEHHRLAVLTEAKVEYICTEFCAGRASAKGLARELQVGVKTVRDVLDGVTWKHVTGGVVQVADPPYRRAWCTQDGAGVRLNEATVLQLRERFHAGESCCSMGRELQMDGTALGDAVFGRSWKHLPYAAYDRKATQEFFSGR